MPKKREKKTPSMADIAKEAGVHKMTVSRALNGQKYVSDEVRRKVEKAAARLGYQKNNLISSVMTHVVRARSVDYGTPIVFLSDAPSEAEEKENVATQRIIKSGKDRAAVYGFSFDTMRYRDGVLSNQRIDQILEARGVQGVIVNVGFDEPVELDLNWDRLVAVTSGGRLKAPRNLPQVHSDIPRYMKRICDELDARGYERIGFLVNEASLDVFSSFSLSSVMVYQNGLPKKRRVPYLLGDYHSCRDQFMGWFEKYKPDVVMSFIPACYDMLIEAGYKIPQDVGYVSTMIEISKPSISGIYLDHGDLAEAAVDHVVQGLMAGSYGVPDKAGRFLIPFSWNEGETLRPRL